MKIHYKPQSVKKFYFLEYFYILLKSIELHHEKNKVFELFKILKKEYQLGESRYKKLTIETENLSETKESRYLYTFEEVIEESIEYKLINKKDNRFFLLTKQGEKLLFEYENSGFLSFKRLIFKLMEEKYFAFNYLVNFCFNANRVRNGLLIFPNYSPLKLGIERRSIKITADIIKYINTLTNRIQKDIREYLGTEIELKPHIEKIISKLIYANLISKKKELQFNPKSYNAILKRIRDFWLDYFLREIYGYEFSLSSFDIWTYRGKQIGILNVTEFFPNFNGRVVYPTSVILQYNNSKDFECIFQYKNELNLYVHSPRWEDEQTQEKFADSLTYAYFEIKKSSRSYFVNLADVRELVCYNMKIPEFLFNEFLNKAYKLNISGKLKVNISLEADRLPNETKAMYLKREPILINESYKNIIAIDLTKKI